MKTVSEFYEFFDAIPEEKWHKGSLSSDFNSCCAVGHLAGLSAITGGAAYDASTVIALDLIFEKAGFCPAVRTSAERVWTINDKGPFKSAKQNILTALQVCAELGVEE
jgi:hypothetical protein